MKLTTLFIILTLTSATACSKKPELPRLGKSGGSYSGDSENGNEPGSGNGTGGTKPNTPGSGTSGQTPVPEVPEVPAEISLVNTKFKGEESKLEALVKYAGAQSARIPLEAGSSAAKFKVSKLITGKAGPLVIEIYEKDKLRFKAVRAETLIEKAKANTFQIEDCAIQKLPWSGEAHENACAWTVSDVKN